MIIKRITLYLSPKVGNLLLLALYDKTSNKKKSCCLFFIINNKFMECV